MTFRLRYPSGSWSERLSLRLRLRPGLSFRCEDEIGASRCLMEVPGLERSCPVEIWQMHFLRLLDGKSNLAEAVRETITRFPESASRDCIHRMVTWLLDHDLVESLPVRKEPPQKIEVFPRPRRKAFSTARLAYVAANVAALVIFLSGVLRLSPGESPSFGLDEIPLPGFAAETPETRGFPVTAVRDGVLTEVLVFDGDRVEAGDVLARVEDPSILNRLQRLRRELGESRVRRDQFYREGHEREYSRETRVVAALSRRIGESEAQSLRAELRAPVAGLVEAGVLCDQIGREVVPGDVLLKVHVAESDLFADNY